MRWNACTSLRYLVAWGAILNGVDDSPRGCRWPSRRFEAPAVSSAGPGRNGSPIRPPGGATSMATAE